MRTTQLKFLKDRETKGSVLYRETDEKGKIVEDNRDAVIGALYIRKSYLNGTAPESVELTLTHP